MATMKQVLAIPVVVIAVWIVCAVFGLDKREFWTGIAQAEPVANTITIEESGIYPYAIPTPVSDAALPNSPEMAFGSNPTEVTVSTPVSTLEAGADSDPPVDEPEATPMPPPEPEPVAEEGIDESGGTVAAPDGSIRLDFPSDAVDEAVDVEITDRNVGELKPPSPDNPLVAAWEFEATEADGSFKPVHTFDKEITVSVQMTTENLLGRNPSTLRYWSYDEQQDSWEELPSEFDAQTFVLTAKTTHFSTGAATADEVVNTSPLLDMRNVNIGTGSASTSIAIDAPAGRGGLAPNLALNYNSGRIGELRQYTNTAGWVGEGWELDTASINIEWEPNSPPRVFLNMQGFGGELMQEGTDGGSFVWRMRREQYLRIRTTCDDFRCPWYVTDKNGTQYVFGTDDATRRWYIETGPSSTYYRRYYRLDLALTQDVLGNKVEYAYDRQMDNDFDSNLQYVVSAYPLSIKYNNDSPTDDRVRIDFVSSYDAGECPTQQPNLCIRKDTPRKKTGGCGTYIPPEVLETRKLDRVDVKVDGQLARQYAFSYSATPFSVCTPLAGHMKLMEVKQKGADGSSVLYAATFGYENLSHYQYGFQYTLPYLTQYTNGFGGTVVFDYLQVSNNAYFGTGQASSRQVVRKEKHQFGAALNQQQETVFGYTYTNVPRFWPHPNPYKPGDQPDYFNADYVGFSEVTEADNTATTLYGDPSGNPIVHRFVYPTQGVDGSADWYTYARIGAEIETIWKATDGSTWHRQVTTYQARGVANFDEDIGYGVTFAYPEYTDTYLKDGTHLRSRSQFDALGNLVRSDDFGEFPAAGDWVANRTAFSVNLSTWVMKPQFAEIIDPEAGNTVLSRTNYYYDGANTTAPATAPALGLLTAVSQRLDASDPTSTSNAYTKYDAFGNIVEQSIATDIRPESLSAGSQYGWLPTSLPRATTVYDSTHSIFPTLTTNPMGHKTQIDYTDYRFGAPTKIRGLFTGNDPDATGVHKAEFDYDTFGRIKKVWDNLDTIGAPTQSYSYTWGSAPNLTLVETKTNESGGIRSQVTCTDGFGRVVEVRGNYGATDPTKMSSTRIDHDERGMVYRISNPKEDDDALNCSNANEGIGPVGATPGRDREFYEYDALGNLTNTFFRTATQPTGGPSTVNGYSGVTSSFCDEEFNKTNYVRDYADRTITVQEPKTTSTTCSPGSMDYNQSVYHFDKLGRLDTFTDALGNETSMEYDLGGRKIEMTDPNMGTWGYEYDVAGNLRQQTDNRGISTTLTYDTTLSRLSERSYSNGDPNVTYDYDQYLDSVCSQPAPTALGRMTKMTDLTSDAGKEYHCFDVRGREEKTRRVIDSTNYDLDRTFDRLNQLLTLTYPVEDGSGTRETVTYNENAYGDLTGMTSTFSGISGSQVLMSNASYTPFGAPETLKVANGASTTAYTYDTRMRLSSIKTGTTSLPGNYQDIALTYDDASNVETVTDYKATGGTETAAYTYDQLNRLKTGTGFSGSQSASYYYDAIGNLVTKTEGSQSLTMCYYASAGCSVSSDQPHAVKTVSGGLSVSISYDDNGNIASQGADTYTFDAENRLTFRGPSGSQTQYVYGGDGLVKKVEPSGATTIYIGEGFEKRTVTSGTTITKYYGANGRSMAMRQRGPSDAANKAASYLLADHLGSTVGLLDGGGSFVSGSRTAYWPFGAARSGGTTLPDKKFTGQQEEPGGALGLYNYGARFYSSVTGRFASVDPLISAPSSPQSWNAYTYARNNPLAYTDPSGMAGCFMNWCTGSGQLYQGTDQYGAEVVYTAEQGPAGGTAVCTSCQALQALAAVGWTYDQWQYWGAMKWLEYEGAMRALYDYNKFVAQAPVRPFPVPIPIPNPFPSRPISNDEEEMIFDFGRRVASGAGKFLDWANGEGAETGGETVPEADAAPIPVESLPAESPQKSLRRQLDTGDGPWVQEGESVVEPANPTGAKIYRGGTSVTERYRNSETGEVLERHRLYGPNGENHGYDNLR